MKRLLPFLFVLVGFAANAQWTPLSGPPGGNVTDLERHPSGKLYAVMNQTLYESTNSGVSWQKTVITTPANNFYVDDLMINSDGKLFALNYSTIYVSDDGTNWTAESTGQFYGMYRIIEFGPDKFLALSGWNGVYVAKSVGGPWTKILSEVAYHDNYKIITNAAGDLFAPTNSAIKRYLYPGAAGTFTSAGWTDIFTASNGFYNVSLGIDNSNNLYASLYYFNGTNYIADLFRSTAASNGTAWTSIVKTGMAEQYFYYGYWAKSGSSIYYIDNNSQKIYSTNSGFATTNYSLTSGSVTLNSSTVTVASTASVKVGDRITGTGIPTSTFVTQILNATSFSISQSATSTGTGLTLTGSTLTTQWSAVSSPAAQFGSSINNIAFASASNYFVGTSGDGVFGTTNSGVNFTQGTGFNAGNGTQIEVANTTGRIIYINNGNSKGYWSSADNGNTWSFSSLSDNVKGIIKLSDGSIILYGNRVYRSADNGLTFPEVSNTYFDRMNQHPTIAGKLYGARYNELLVTTNSGTTWTNVSITGLPTSWSAYYLTVTATDQVYMIVYNYVNSKYEVYKVSAGTATLMPNAPWTNSVYFYPNNIFTQSSKLYITTSDAIFSTSDDGSTWTTSNFSGNYVFPISQGSYTGIAISRYGSLYITQDDGKSYNSSQLSNTNSYITDLALDNTGKFVASAANSTALKNPNNLLVDPATLPVYINFNWQPTNGPYGGYVDNITVDATNTVYSFSKNQNRYYRANAAVTSWTRISSSTNEYFYDMTARRSNGVLYGLTYDKIFTSSDKGVTWTLFNSESILQRDRILVTSNNVVAMVAGNQIFATAANGTTFGTAKYSFTSTESFYSYSDAFISTSAGVILVQVRNETTNVEKLKRSTDNGVTWTDVALPNDVAYKISVDNFNNVYVMNPFGIFKSTDNGTTWTSIKGDLSNPISSSAKVVVSPTNVNELYIQADVSGAQVIKKSINGGTNWTDLGALPLQYLDMNLQGTKMVFGTYKGVYTSTDGLTFVEANSGITGLSTSDLYLASQDRLLVGVSDGQYDAFRSEDKGNNWQKAPHVFREFFNHPDGSLIGIVADGDKAYRSIDAGATWLLYANFPHFARQYFTSNGTDHYLMSYSDVYYSNNLTTWTKLVLSGLPDENNRGFIEIAVDADGIGYVILSNYQSSEVEAYQILFGSGIQLNQVSNPRSVKYRNNKIYLYGSEGTLATTTDGSNWTLQSAPSGNKLILATKDYYFIPAYGGALWMSRNQGLTWQSVGLNSFSNENSFQDVVVNEFDGYAYAILTNSVVRKSANIVIPDDATAPVITNFSPASNSTGASIKPRLTITFDEGVIPQSAKTLRILDVANQVTPLETINVTSGVQVGKSFTFTLSNFLDFNKQYFIAMDAGSYKDIFGNSHAGILNTTTWRFTTKAAPTLSSLVPAKDATNVSLTPVLSMNFSEKMGVGAGKKLNIYESTNLTTPVESVDLLLPANDAFVQMFPSGNSADQQVKVIFNAAIGGGELKGATKVYMHAGVVTSGLTGTAWVNTVGNWGQDDGIGQMTKVPGETDMWEITLSPTARQYFSVAAGTNIYRLAMVFRNASGSLKAAPPSTIAGGTVADNGDVYLDFGAGSTGCKATVSQNNTQISITPCTTLKYQTSYVVKLDAGAITTSEGFALNLINTNTDWVFTTIEAPDTQKPAIVFTTSNLEKGAGKTFEITVNDNKPVPTNKTKMFYRKITEPSTAAFASVDMTVGSGSGTTSSKFTAAVQESWYDAMGLEFYFETEDAAANKERSPATAGAYHYSYIDYKSSATYPTLNSVLSFGGNQNNYRIVAIPYTLSSTTISTLFNEIGGGAVDKTQWRVFELNLNRTGYSEPTSFLRGQGYWVNIRTNPGDIKIEGSASPAYNKSSFDKITLKPGWNMIGNPYPVEISWEETRAGNAAVSKVKLFNGTAYADGDVLQPLQGGFVNVTGSSNVTLIVRFKGITTGGRIGQQDIPADLSEKNWFVPITATNNDITNALGGVGMHEKANIGWDEFDDMNPPRFLDAAELAFIKSNVDVKKLAKDFVPTQDEFVWDLNVEAGAGLTTLTWNNADIETNGKELILFDVVRQQLVDMKAEGSYSFNAKEGNTFKVYFGTNLRSKIKPTAITLSKPYPNPTHSETAIVFTLPDTQTSYQTALEVYNSSGQRVNTLAQGNFQSGFYTSTWSGEGQPNGLYFVRLTVLEGGTYKTLTEKVVVNR